MGDGFTVDYDALDQMGEDLQALADEFDGMKDHMEQYEDAVGQPPPEPGASPIGGSPFGGGFGGSRSVPDELIRVAKNWSDDREEIVGKMETAAGYATQAAAVYRDLDTGLADEFSSTGD